MVDPEPAVEIRELTKRYGEFTALDSLTMSVGKGQILGFIGPNGAGKTTTIKILVGLLKATSGAASIAGVDCLTDSRRIKRLVGYMPDDFGKYNNMRVSEYLDFFGAAYGIGRRARTARIDEVLEIAGATHMKDLFVDALSRGMQQRVAIARTLIHDPDVMILDEPANGLDPQARIDMRTMLLRLAGMGKTLIVTSHILPELARVCDLVAIITRGKLRAYGTVDEIMSRIGQRRTFEVLLVSENAVESVSRTIQGWLAQNESGTGESGSRESSAERVTALGAERIVRFETGLADDALSQLLKQVVDAGETVVQFREVPTDLEDAYLTVTDVGQRSDSDDSAATTPSKDAVGVDS